jgi:CRP-like cAMP-binding protein
MMRSTQYPEQSPASHVGYRSDAPPGDPSAQDSSDGRTSESPLDHALTLLLAGEVDAAMRWAAAVLERSPSPAALLVTCRLLEQMGRARAAVEGLKLTVQLSVDRGDLPLAMAAIHDLQALGPDGGEEIEMVASAFCRGSARLVHGRLPPLLPAAPASDFVQPLSPFLSGPSLASKAAQAVHKVRSRSQEGIGGELPGIRPLPLFSALTKNALIALLSEFHAVTIPPGQTVFAEGDDGGEAYVVVRGEVEISRHAAHGDNGFTLALARLHAGAFFGETALISNMPSPASARTTRPTILLAARREDLVAVSSSRSEIATELAVHCRRNSLATLGWTSPVVAAVPPGERAALVERLEMRVFEKGDLLVRSGEEAPGLHLIVSGEVAIVAKEWGERVMLATLGAGDTVGEMELVLCRRPFADALATRPTAALFLSRSEYASLIQDHPAILHGLYAVAVQRQSDTNFVLDSAASVVSDDWLLDAASLNAPSNVRAELVDSKRSIVAAAPASAKPVVQAPARRTLPPPPLPRTFAPPPPSSLTPSAHTVPAINLAAPQPPTPWGGVAAVMGLTAVAASVITVFALRGSAAAPAAATQPRPAAVDVLPPVSAPAYQPPAIAIAPLAVANAAPLAQGAVTSAAVPAPAASASAPADLRKPTITATPPSPPVKAVPVAPVARPVQRVAAQPAAPAASAAAPSAISAAADEFGGRQ